jgi:hypothetical protein
MSRSQAPSVLFVATALSRGLQDTTAACAMLHTHSGRWVGSMAAWQGLAVVQEVLVAGLACGQHGDWEPSKRHALHPAMACCSTRGFNFTCY